MLRRLDAGGYGRILLEAPPRTRAWQAVNDRIATGRVEITSQNHGFAVVPESLPESVETTHLSLFDGSHEGMRLVDRPVFSVQYHPEASPGPHDADYLFRQFLDEIEQR